MPKYDVDSGQVFREWTVARPTLTTSYDRDWSRAQPTATLHARGAHGPRSLVDMATSVVAINVGSLTGDLVDDLPPRVRLRVWQFLEARGANLHAWKLFRKHLLHGEDGSEPTLSQYRYRQHICRPTHSLNTYTQPLTSPTYDFITHLIISGGCSFPTSEMVALADMPNLGALEIIQPTDDLRNTFPNVTDLLVRGWTAKSNPFPLLRVLRIWGDSTTTQDSLRHLVKLPSLALYDVMGSRDDWGNAAQYGVASGWSYDETHSRVEDPLFYDLKLLMSDQREHLLQWRLLSAKVDGDLTRLCYDTRCAVQFVPYGEAPELKNYLQDDSIERSSRNAGPPGNATSCNGVAFEAWAFWTYSFIGQLFRDKDLVGQETQTVAGPFVLPAKPMACVFLGHSGRGGIATRPSYIRRGLFATKRYTFTRDLRSRKKEIVETGDREKKEEREGKRKVKGRKRQKLNAMLQHFG